MTNRQRAEYCYEDLLRAGSGSLFAQAGPRLPLPPMLMFDRVTRISQTGGAYGRGEVRAALDVKPDLWFFDCHFRGDPVMPGCLGLDAMWQLIGFFLAWLGAPGRGRALGVGKVRFSGMVLPSARQVEYRLDIKRILRGRLVMGVADGVLAVDGEEIYKAADLQAGLFTDAALSSGQARLPDNQDRQGAGGR